MTVQAMRIGAKRNAAAGAIARGRGSIFIVGGTESMSNIPFLFKQRTAEKIQPAQPREGLGTLANHAAFRRQICCRASV